MSAPPVRTLIVDDSALVRRAVTRCLARDPGIQVVGTAGDPYIARDKILELNPDVLTLDIEMPRMDGLTFLRLIMKHRPMPVIVMSSLTHEGSLKALEALHLGAVDVLDKPSGSYSAYTDGRLATMIKLAAGARFRSLDPASPPAPGTPQHPHARPESTYDTQFLRRALPPSRTGPSPRDLIVIGASTGGTEALRRILPLFPDDLPPICIVQHIPARFSLAFANRLNDLCPFAVREARGGERLDRGLALVAPGGHHLLLRWHGSHYSAHLTDGPMVHHQRPAVDVLFDSAVKAGAGPHTLALLLTGMGADGAAGMLSLRTAGATTVAQNEATCVVYGMPHEAVKLGAAQHLLPLEALPDFVNRFWRAAHQPAPAVRAAEAHSLP